MSYNWWILMMQYIFVSANRFYKVKENFQAPFYGWGSTASRLEPLRGGSLLFTTKFPEIPGTHFINLGRMKDSWLWSHLVILNAGLLDWESSTLTTTPVLHNKIIEQNGENKIIEHLYRVFQIVIRGGGISPIVGNQTFCWRDFFTG